MLTIPLSPLCYCLIGHTPMSAYCPSPQSSPCTVLIGRYSSCFPDFYSSRTYTPTSVIGRDSSSYWGRRLWNNSSDTNSPSNRESDVSSKCFVFLAEWSCHYFII